MTSVSLNPIIDLNTGQPYADQTPHRGDIVSFDIVDLPNRWKSHVQLILQAYRSGTWLWTYIASGSGQGQATSGPSVETPVKLDNDDLQYASYPWLTLGGEADIDVIVRGGTTETLATLQFHCLDVR